MAAKRGKKIREKGGKEEKISAVAGHLPTKQGLKLTERFKNQMRDLLQGIFQQNKD